MSNILRIGQSGISGTRILSVGDGVQFLGGGAAAEAASNWWLIVSAERISAGGLAEADFAANSAVSGNSSGGRTFITTTAANRIRQDTTIRRVAILTPSFVGSDAKIKVFRPSGSNYDFVGESETIALAGDGAVETFNLSTPIEAAMGDYIGIWLENIGAISSLTVKSSGTLRFAAGDITSANSFASSLGYTLNIEALSTPPFLAVSGDSIAEGHNVGDSWHSIYHAGIAGTPTSEIANQLRGLIGEGDSFEYQNHAKGSQTFGWVNSTGMPGAVATKAPTILILCGVNDVSGGRTWAAVESDLDAISAQLGVGQRLFLCEILPWTNGSDAQAGTIRTWNGNIVTWAAANDATVIAAHDAMGQIRVSTGELDNLKSEYNQDGVHLTQAGVNALAAIWKAVLQAYYG